jgi:hypothetical protein
LVSKKSFYIKVYFKELQDLVKMHLYTKFEPNPLSKFNLKIDFHSDLAKSQERDEKDSLYCAIPGPIESIWALVVNSSHYPVQR